MCLCIPLFFSSFVIYFWYFLCLCGHIFLKNIYLFWIMDPTTLLVRYVKRDDTSPSLKFSYVRSIHIESSQHSRKDELYVLSTINSLHISIQLLINDRHERQNVNFYPPYHDSSNILKGIKKKPYYKTLQKLRYILNLVPQRKIFKFDKFWGVFYWFSKFKNRTKFLILSHMGSHRAMWSYYTSALPLFKREF